jgi:hypothetical protein
MVSEKRNSSPIPSHVLSRWHPTKNLPLVPEKVSAGSSKRIIHWICEKGHEWTGTVVNEVKRSYPCKECSRFVLKTDGSDLLTNFPGLAKEWHPTKNKDLLPSMVSAKGRNKVWWLGSCNHEWEAVVSNRVGLSHGCPYCSGNTILVGFNDLGATDPDIATEWHPVLNADLLPTMVSRGSNKKAWWLGKCGHEWDMQVTSRTTKNQSCPFCAGNRVLVSHNDLATLQPHLIAEWDVDKNDSMPQNYTVGSNVPVWWKCKEKHSWYASIGGRKYSGCPDCASANAGVTKSTPKNGTDLATYDPIMAAEWHPVRNLPLTPNDVNGGAKCRVWWQCKQGHEWQAKISDRRFYKTQCPICALDISISRGHQAIADFLISHGLIVNNNDRKILDGKEIDIYLPEKKFGIEYNGLYWHTENAGKDSQYHYDKWDTANQKGIQLIQIWEDEWEKNPELIKNMIAHKLGLSSQQKIFARKTYVSILNKKDAENFLLENHIQGYASGGHYYGLKEKENDNLVSVLVLKKEKNDTLNIIRYATACNVVGGFTKLLSYAGKELNPQRFITFSDNCVSDGGLYENNGFIADKALNPDYRYVVGNNRAHKFGYRLKRFREDPNLLWEEGKTERELAILNNLPRIWDAGKIRWVKENN